MANTLIQQIAEGLGATQPVNGSWIEAIADYYGLTSPVNGSWEEAIARHLGATSASNGTWIEAMAQEAGLSSVLNGTWLYAIADNGLSPTYPIPTGLSSTAQGYTTLDYGWTAGGSETSWEVEYGPAGVGGNFDTAVTNSYQITSLNPETSYQLRVRAIISAGTFSNYTSLVVADTNTIGTPTNLTATSIDSSSFTAGWDAVADADLYEVEYGLDGFSTGSGTIVTASTSSKSITGLSADTAYEFQVRTNIGSNDGDYSARYDVSTLTAATFVNTYSMNSDFTLTSSNIEYLRIDNKSNAIDTALRDTTPNFSVSGWFKVDDSAASETRIIFAKYENYQGDDRCFKISLDTSNRFKVYGRYDLTNETVNLQTTQTFSNSDGWVHYCFVYDHSETTASEIAKLYINGVEVTAWDGQTVNTTQKYFENQATESERGYVATADFAGFGANLPSRGFGGELDEITFWDKSLSSSEVTEMYNSGDAYDISDMSAYSSNCLAWYRMGDDASDNWDGSKWNIVNVKGTADTDLISVNMVEADRVSDAP